MPKKKAAKRSKRRWVCPECEVGVLAPQTMHALDVRRFCLDCSGEKGRRRLVERKCIAAERKRAERKKRTAKKRAKRVVKRKQADAIAYFYAGVHMKRELHRIARLTVFKGSYKGDVPDLKLIDVGARGGPPNYARGSYARSKGGKLTITVEHDKDCDPQEVQAAMLVQLVLQAKGHDDLAVDRIGVVAKAAYKLDPHYIAAAPNWWQAQERVGEGLREQA